MDCDEAGYAVAFGECAPNKMSRAFRGNHDDIDGIGRNNLFVVDIEPVGKGKCVARLHVGSNFRIIDGFLVLVGEQDHDDICPFDGICNGVDLQAGCTGFLAGSAVGTQTHSNIQSALFQVQRMGMALAAITEHCDIFTLQIPQIGILLIINIHL